MLLISCVFSQYCLAQKLDSIQPVAVKVSAKAVPNPIQNKLNIEVKNFEAGLVKVVIVNSKGNVIYNDKRLVVNHIDNIALFLNFTSGNYFCTITQQEKVAKFGFLVAK
jgi:hypothetical protein